MKKTLLLATAAMFGVVFLAANVNAQGVPQTVEITKVDVQKVSAGYRASKVIGSSVVNDANETIGKIDDLLVTRDGKEPYAVLSVGGFLGMGTGSDQGLRARFFRRPHVDVPLLQSASILQLWR